MAESLKRTEYYYNTDNVLQNVAVWEFPEETKAAEAPSSSSSSSTSGATKKYWLIFIHGGAWRDPRATLDEAEPTINALLASSSPLPNPSSRIAGIASINYRLSPHPSYAQDPSHTPGFAARTARHPDHLDDVLAGLRFLQGRYGFGEGYVLFGHSAGAFLGYQVVQGQEQGQERGGEGGQDVDVVLPAAVVGFEGIYDLVGLNGRMGGGYSSFMEGAFGTDRGVWEKASPATARGSFGAWASGGGAGSRLAVLAQSPGDELVDMPEVDTMEARLRADGVADVLVFRDLRGGHFDVLNDGSFARVLVATLEALGRMDGA